MTPGTHTHTTLLPVPLLRRFVLPILAALLLVLFWLGVGSLFMAMPPALGVVWIAIVTAAFLWVHGYRQGIRDQARRVVRLRPLGSAGRWVVIGIAPMLLFHAFFLVIYLWITGIPDPTPNPLEGYMRRPGGWLVLAVFLGIAVPIVEEFGIRGWIQRPLERRIGTTRAILITAIIFAVAHLQLLGLPTRFFAGVFFGYAVWATGSIWAAVILHGAHNLSLIIPAAFAPEPTREPQPPSIALLVFAAAGLVAMTVILIRLARRMREEAIQERARLADAAPPPHSVQSSLGEGS